MVATITTRFRRCCPLIDFFKGFTVLRTLLFEYLKKTGRRHGQRLYDPRAVSYPQDSVSQNRGYQMLCKARSQVSTANLALWRATFLCCLAKARHARYQLLEPLTLRLSALLRDRNMLSDCLKNCGDSILSPSLLVRNVLFP